MASPRSRDLTPIPAGSVDELLVTAARAPSIFNTQPWLFRVTRYTIELYADPRRRLRSDRTGREMLVSCGAALYGLRLGVRNLGYQPEVRVLPDPDRPALLATVRLGEQAPANGLERAMLEALPHRHTHRGPFEDVPLPRGLLVALQHDAVAERASLALVDGQTRYDRLAGIVAAAARSRRCDDRERADIRQWARLPGSDAKDGVPAAAFAAVLSPTAGRLPERDLDLGRGIGQLPSGGAPASATGVLLTSADTRADWIRAGQALHRVLAHAASVWVFASLHSQALESPGARQMISSAMGFSGAPQLILQFGVSRMARPTARNQPAQIVPRQRRQAPEPVTAASAD